MEKSGNGQAIFFVLLIKEETLHREVASKYWSKMCTCAPGELCALNKIKAVKNIPKRSRTEKYAISASQVEKPEQNPGTAVLFSPRMHGQCAYLSLSVVPMFSVVLQPATQALKNVEPSTPQTGSYSRA